ncbi:glycosyl transferase family 2 [Prosthecochloris sp. GSB1]|uniref:glycosyltransferase family 2 protein n=1 Tax=Prosthecochloris sp. GSB1 TaxID=281093 RepID=UPI000B8C7C28|nr:glycosyltransferase family 2 protein [Prosthecochloris sp. GSB1]ASQ90339.1 glycosyl transferase family 2 [Prosthecochloris sp. GSB1]
MDISVVISNYNYGHLVERAIESVLDNEGDFLCEIIVVDDHSSDNSREMLRRQYGGHEKVHLLFSKENRGQFSCFRKGIGIASGDVISFLDPDDRYEPSCFREVARIFEVRPEVDFVYTGYRDIGRREQLVLHAEQDFDIGSTMMMTALTGRHFWSITSTMFLRRKLARRVTALPEHYDLEFESRGDTVLELGATIIGSYRYYLAKPLMQRTIHDMNYSVTGYSHPQALRRYKHALRRVRAFFVRDCAIPDDSPGMLYREFRALPYRDRKALSNYRTAVRGMRLFLPKKWLLDMLLVSAYIRG